MAVDWPAAAPDVIFAAAGTQTVGGFHEQRQDSALDWIGRVRPGSWNAPCLACGGPREVPPAAYCQDGIPGAVLLRHAGRVPEHTARQYRVLDALRAAGVHCDGRGPRSLHPSADSARCKRLLRRGRQVGAIAVAISVADGLAEGRSS